MLTPQLYHCPEKLKGILHTDENGYIFFVFGDKYISLDMIRMLVENNEGITMRQTFQISCENKLKG